MAKLKEILPLLKTISERFIQVIESEENNQINVSKYLDRFTMDSVWNCAFGIDIECQKNHDNIFFVKAVEFFKNTAKLSPFVVFNSEYIFKTFQLSNSLIQIN